MMSDGVKEILSLPRARERPTDRREVRPNETKDEVGDRVFGLSLRKLETTESTFSTSASVAIKVRGSSLEVAPFVLGLPELVEGTVSLREAVSLSNKDLVVLSKLSRRE